MSKVTSLKREFEVDRIIFFSDAVFAIAITLLVLDIKVPELQRGDDTGKILTAFKPMLLQFGAFAISFVFVASMWYRHLQLFRFLAAYNSRLIFLNLLFIFFIVCFPFVVSGLTKNMSKSFLLPIFLYLTNISLSVFSQYLICAYIFRIKPGLCVRGNDAQKRYLLLQARHTSFIFLLTLIVCTISYFISGGHFMTFVLSVYLLPVLLFVSKRILRKQKAAARLEKEQASRHLALS